MAKLKLTIGLAIALSGCAITPSINYRDWNEHQRDDSWVPYQLTDTTLVIGVSGQVPGNTSGGAQTGAGTTPPAKPPAGAAKPGKPAPGSAVTPADATSQTPLMQPVSHSELYPVSLAVAKLDCTAEGCSAPVTAAAVPIPFEGETFGIEPASHWLVYTRIAPKYFSNSLRLQSLEFSVEDKREEALQTMAAIASGTAKLATESGMRAAAIPMPLHLPVVIDLADAKHSIAANPQDPPNALPLPANPGWKYSIRFLDHPDDAGFLKRGNKDDLQNVHGAVLTSLCRPLQISLTNGVVTLVMGVTVADPDYLLSIPLPPSGTVTFSDLCGADVTTQKATTTPSNTLASDFFADVQAVRTALARPN